MKWQTGKILLLTLVMSLMLNTAVQAADVQGLICYGGPTNDQGFNQMAYEGMNRAMTSFAPKLNMDVFINKKADKLSVEDITKLGNKNDFIIGLGDVYLPIFAKLAASRPKTKFVVIDGDKNLGMINLLCVKFNDLEAGFLAGIAAGATTNTKNIGFIGGYKNLRSNQELLSGYKAGAYYVNPAIKVKSDFVGSFTDPEKLEKKALQMYGERVDVIFHAAGMSGKGLFIAAAKVKKLAIGCDTNQRDTAPEEARPYILTSALKRVDNAVYSIIDDIVNEKFKSGLRVEDCSTGGIGYADSSVNNKALVKAEPLLLDANAELTLKAIKIPVVK
ncbi:MAG: BMP family ABC transporter substrate-binding protein [Acholeplasmataceae bacterium]|nr:BMP family ABC transporter substrate-binding protein [Acholeplasmataceae bacterium]